MTLTLLAFGVAGIVGNLVAGVTLGRGLMTMTAAAWVLSRRRSPCCHCSRTTPAPSSLGGLGWGALPLAMQRWMAAAVPDGVESSLALFVTTVQVTLAVGSVLGGVAVTAWGVDVDFRVAGAVAFVGVVVFVFVASALRRSRRCRASRWTTRPHDDPRGTTCPDPAHSTRPT